MSILNQRNPKKVKTMLIHEKCLIRRHLSLSVYVAEVNWIKKICLIYILHFNMDISVLS